MKRNSAVTLIEMLVVMAVMAIIALPLYISYTRTQANQTLRASTEQLADTFRRAHVFAREAKDEKAWAVKSDSLTSYSLIAGNDANFKTEKATTLETFVKFPADFRVWFEVGTGDARMPQSVTIENTYGKQFVIEIFKTGIVEIKEP